MSLSDNLRRLARERIPTAPANWLGPITPTVYTNDSTLTEAEAEAEAEAKAFVPSQPKGPVITNSLFSRRHFVLFP
jgi:hypothetical protein